jgi:hypothetical protein
MDPEGKSMTATGHILGRVATLVGAIVVGLFVVALLMLGTG